MKKSEDLQMQIDDLDRRIMILESALEEMESCTCEHGAYLLLSDHEVKNDLERNGKTIESPSEV